jgi:hypothetical protein
MQTTMYGELESEKLSKDKNIAREIVKEISNFGISDRQRWLVIYFLALEAENHFEMQALTDLIKELKSTTIFLEKET